MSDPDGVDTVTHILHNQRRRCSGGHYCIITSTKEILTLLQAMFRKAVSTIEGWVTRYLRMRKRHQTNAFNSVKADPLFSYQSPVNLVALLIMLPASHILSPRWFHKVETLNFCTPMTADVSECSSMFS